MRNALFSAYLRVTVGHPLLAALAVVLLFAAAIFYAQDFRLDASSDSLVLENDQDLAYYRTVTDRYGSEEFIVVTYTPHGDLFSDATFQDVQALKQDLLDVDIIASVTTILDVPLIQSPPVTLTEVAQDTRTLLDPGTDREMARQEFKTSPLYRNLLVSPDGSTTAIQGTLTTVPDLGRLLEERNRLRQAAAQGELTADQSERLAEVSQRYDQLSETRQAEISDGIAQIRTIMDGYRDNADLFLGGVPMIASDMIDFVRSDIEIFSGVVGVLLVLLLALAFRRLRWVVLPTTICAVVVISMVGLLGFMDWPVTVVSSNFTALTLIITLSLTVHLVVRHMELHAEHPDASQRWLVSETLRSKFAPSVFTTATTIISFASLIIADIRPVIDFGLMMVCGVALAFLVTFLLYPAALTPLKTGSPSISSRDITAHITQAFAGVIERFGKLTLALYAILLVAAVIGITRLGVENRFIDYFKPSTEIYQGMVQIDKKLGGTTPLDIIINAPQDFLDDQAAFEEEFGGALGSGGLSADSYWFNSYELETVQAIHDYLDGLPETGKVLSLATTMDMMTQLNGGEPLSNFILSIMYKRLPADIKSILIDPYMSDDGNQIRFSIRVIDSDQNLRRDALLKKVRTDLIEQFELEPEQVHLSGLLVLYNNVLQSLFDSQIKTMGTVFIVIALMLAVLFRSIPLALIGVVPTLFAAASILGLMGWLGIPLDIMTITIAAITIGIGVDNTIHYTHRFVEEVTGDGPAHGDYWAAMRNTHGSVGRAIYYTSITVTVGFSILALSNFVPITYFGLFTGLAMLLALIANLTLLPLLFALVKPIRVPATS